MSFVDPYMPASPGLIWSELLIKVFRYTPGGTPTTVQLPNVQAINCISREGSDPGTAVFRYDLTWPNPTNAPQTVEEAVNTLSTKPWVINPSDRLTIQATKPDGTKEILFDGKALDWEVVLSDREETVEVTAYGIAKEEWSTPIPGQYARDGDAPATVSDVVTDLPASFNPKGEPNASPAESDAGTDPLKKYPTFLDPLVIRSPDVRRMWTLPMACAHILFKYNDETYIKNPARADLDVELVAKIPTSDSTPFDPGNPGTYTPKDLIVADTPITGRDWPNAVNAMIQHFGFGMKFELTTDGATGAPINTLILYNPQEGTQKPILMQARGANLDRALTNCPGATIHRKLSDVANEWWVQGRLQQYEVSVILQCGFPCAAADAADANALAVFERSDPSYTTTNHDKYRLYLFDETGEGHYAPGSTTIVNTVQSLDAVLGAGNYVKRRRKALGDLITKDEANKIQKARLAISTDYAASAPGLWSGSGTWQPVQGGWELLKDRLGIRITADNPNRWKIGESKVTGHPYPVGVVKGVEAQVTGGAHFYLRLTCVIEGDQVLEGRANRRTASPVTAAIIRKVDARDRYRTDTVSAHSEFNTTATDVVPRDDTDAAKAEAVSSRYMTESGVLNATFQIDHITTAYEIGDRISTIQGRNTPLRTDAGLTGENPILPVVVEREFTFSPVQSTTLRATDSGTGRSFLHHRTKTKTRHG